MCGPKRGAIDLERIEIIVDVGSGPGDEAVVKRHPLHRVHRLERHAVLIAVILVLRVEADVEIPVGPVAVLAAGHSVADHAKRADHHVMIAPVRLDPRMQEWFHRFHLVVEVALLAGILWFVWSHVKRARRQSAA